MIFQIPTANLINCIVISAGIGLCGLCFVQITTSVDRRNVFRRYFQVIFPLLIVYMSTYLVRRLMDGFPGEGVHVAMFALPFIELFVSGVLPYLISLLLITFTRSDRAKKRLQTVMHLLLALHGVLLILGSAYPAYYYIDAENVYHRGPFPYYLIVDVVPFVMLIIAVVLLLCHGRMISRRVRIAFWIYMTAPLVGMVVQGLHYGVGYIIFTTVAGSLFMYAAILRDQAERMKRQSQSIDRMQNGLVLVLADLVESRDQCTGDHVQKTSDYTRIVMEQMRRDGSYTDQLTDDFMEDVVRSAPLHDIGKIRVPDAILNKPGKLTPEEFEEIKQHTTAGRDIITRAIDMVAEETSGYLNEARNLAYCHHEKWNGTGYPQGLAGEEIPLSARIMAVADVFDALVSKRSYKDEYPFETAMNIIREGSGTHFDPKVADAFVRAEDEVRRVICGAKA